MRTKLKPSEKVILITRPHWYPSLFNPLFFTAFCFTIGVYIGGFFYLIALLSLGFAIYKVLDRQCNIWAVTNLRVIDEHGLLTHYAIESPLDKINNVSFSQNIWGRLIGYGNVMIQTAAGHGATTYLGVENPQQLKDTITTMQEEYKKSAAKEQTKALVGMFTSEQQNNSKVPLTTELEKIYELKQKGILTEDEYFDLKAKILNS